MQKPLGQQSLGADISCPGSLRITQPPILFSARCGLNQGSGQGPKVSLQSPPPHYLAAQPAQNGYVERSFLLLWHLFLPSTEFSLHAAGGTALDQSVAPGSAYVDGSLLLAGMDVNIPSSFVAPTVELATCRPAHEAGRIVQSANITIVDARGLPGQQPVSVP